MESHVQTIISLPHKEITPCKACIYVCFMIYANYFTMKLTSSYNLHDLITWACTGLNYGMTKRNVFLDMKAYLQNWVKHKFKTWRGSRKWNIHNLHKWQMLGIMWETLIWLPRWIPNWELRFHRKFLEFSNETWKMKSLLNIMIFRWLGKSKNNEKSFYSQNKVISLPS